MDKLTQLPNDVLYSIMYRLTTKEAAKLSVLSHKWNKLWACYPGIFNFDDPMTDDERRKVMREVWFSKKTKALVIQDTCKFVRWITHIVEQHVGPSLEKFKVTFDLDNTYQAYIDKWVVFALLKGVSSLELEFNGSKVIEIEQNFYSMPFKSCVAHKSPHGLKTLVLSHMEIATEVFECFIQSCPFLENLRLCRISSLRSIRGSCPLPSLKHFDVYKSPELEVIDILAPKLFEFRYHGRNVELNIQNALSLYEVSLGSELEPPTHALKSISEYFPQLEYLHMSFSMYSKQKLVFPSTSRLTNVKHMKLTIKAYSEQSLLGWMTLIEASPVLEKLTLKASYPSLSLSLSQISALLIYLCICLNAYNLKPRSFTGPPYRGRK